MTRRARKHLLKPLVFLLAAVALEGCISPTADSIGRYTAPIGGSPVIMALEVDDADAVAEAMIRGGATVKHTCQAVVGVVGS